MIFSEIKHPCLFCRLQKPFEPSVAEEIKGFRPNLPIIAQSAYALEEDLDRYSKIFDSYLIKPLNRTEMITKIKKYIHIEN
ncbi:MAG TPA: hypothetical protein PL048_22290 [Leptospiraceae bacterium]|nr:hypothetical protein [Leptospiraceae bacterium]HNF14724.1 hypothetical protein [Leptospiraceae bacterium]HNF27998.1 hypothetical protein [Leptospiraceae bacterium]HNI95748.1 hypothetical protein [Leptospiraceae bacterium]HNM06498.1 hypothetical protein [Leptospiraceae bacterium]